MKILMLVNWKVEYCDSKPGNKQPPDYYVKGEPYWFFRYFKEQPDVDVMDVSTFGWLEKFEKQKIRFHVLQAIKAIPRLDKYDLIVSHGMQSGVVISLMRRLVKTKAKHIVFDIGSFNSAAEEGMALKLMQYASRSIDHVIYHTSSQAEYYKKFYPWLMDKSSFMRFGTDLDFFAPSELSVSDDSGRYIICVGYSKRDWDTVVEAYTALDTDINLRLVGHVEEKYKNIKGIEQVPFVPVKELINQIYNSLFCVLPLESFNYSYGQMTLMQQQALEKCVITARVPSLVDYIVDNETAIMYTPKDVNDLKSKMEAVINNGVLRNRIAKQGREYLLHNCNEKIMSMDIEQCFKNVLN